MNSKNVINTNIEDYTTEELLQILNLDEDANSYLINKSVNETIAQFKETGDVDVINFLKKARDRILQELQTDYETDDEVANEQPSKASEWYKTQYLEPTSRLQSIKLTDRIQQVETFNQDGHYPMKQNLLGVNNAYQLPVAQDTLNPTLRNINTTIVNLDSQFRNIIYPYVPNDANASASSTNYAIDLTDPLTNVLSIRAYSIQIPNTWYRFSEEQGNTCFFVTLGGTDGYQFVLPNGNYISTEIVNELNNHDNWFLNGVQNNNPTTSIIWNYNANTAKLEFTVAVGSSVIFYFYDINGKYTCNPSCINVTQLNQNLGWSLGFRVTSQNPYVNGVFSTQTYSAGLNSVDSELNLYGPKYFSIILDDFNQNRQNKGLVNIGMPDTKLSLPNYYSNDLDFDSSCNAVPTIPRRITQAQLYTINQIKQNRTVSKQRTYGANNSDVLAVLPLDIAINTQEKPYTTFGANLIFNERRYFGPVNISRMKIRLVDDKGNTVNLNGADWAISLITTELYQY
ncbi:MAG: hypothetical protein WD512_12255 [Candidatus Paceibacterota bacterium]